LTDTQCSAPDLNGIGVDVINSPSSGFIVGFNATIGCMAGFVHTGTAETVITTCQSGRTWSQTLLPTCISKIFFTFI